MARADDARTAPDGPSDLVAALLHDHDLIRRRFTEPKSAAGTAVGNVVMGMADRLRHRLRH